MIDKKRWGFITVLLIVFVFISSLRTIATLYTDYLWFVSIGAASVFITKVKTQIIIFSIFSLLCFIFLKINMIIAKKEVIKTSVVALLSLFVGMVMSGYWLDFLVYKNKVDFLIQDPIFGKDVSYYTFSLPFYELMVTFSFFLFTTALIITILNYFKPIIELMFRNPINETDNDKSIDISDILSQRKAIVHCAALVSLLFGLIALKDYFKTFSIMYSEQGIVVGAGYTDVYFFLPIIKILIYLALFVAASIIIWIFTLSKHSKQRNLNIIILTILGYVIISFFVPPLLTGLVQSLKVSPNEINLEKPFIEHNIKFTKEAYGLSEVKEYAFNYSSQVNIEGAKDTIENARILDWRPLVKTYKQTQEIRLYYDLSGVDIDRYTIDGKYISVMLAPREMNQDAITTNAKTWVNQHMVYTHGYGIVMSPVNKVTDQGLPDYYIKDIPPVYTVKEASIKIDKPQIYFGEKDNTFVLVNTNTAEFDYPKGNTNEYNHYSGKGGVVLSSFVRKIAFALSFGDIKILLSSDIKPESKILYNRNIQNRIKQIVPFIALDNDPYLVIKDGRILWIQDAYTTSDRYPYSEKFNGINYIRNSVKVIVDAYDGSVDFYISDTNDPIIKTYKNIFPGLFNDMNDFPAKEHIRYPEDLFKIQSSVYSIYHMNDPTVFYNKEDAWQIPNEIYGVGQQVKVEPYYIIMTLPGEIKEEFLLMTSFTPIKKDNMISWMAARSDGEEYGNLVLYKFPKDTLIYGPLQIEAKFDQDSEISQQLTLWSQQGSQVTRGNLLVIPVKNSILYIEPLYIQAEQGQLPELKRILASDGEKVVMEKNMGAAMNALFGSSSQKYDNYNSTSKDFSQDANVLYDNLLAALAKHDWVEFGKNFEALGLVLDELANE